ncbi:hypothetical protein BDR06DRAFT_490963 [Suillus hirtellus]|nr:hypothetical protein BDR06DRAFT_490963 [Suillus hirtellus]
MARRMVKSCMFPEPSVGFFYELMMCSTCLWVPSLSSVIAPLYLRTFGYLASDCTMCRLKNFVSHRRFIPQAEEVYRIPRIVIELLVL